MQTSPPERIAFFRQRGWWGDTTTWDLFAEAIERARDETALVDPANRESLTGGAPGRYSFGELREAVERFCCGLLGAGIRAGDTVVTQLPNITESVIGYLAMARLGVIASPVPMQYGAHELRGIAAKLAPRAYLATDGFKGEDYAARNSVAFDGACRMLRFAAGRGARDLLCDGKAVEAATDESLEAQLARHRVSADDVFTVCWTSGTTGTPKGVPRSHNQWLSQTIGMMSVGVQERASMLCPFPLVNMASLSGFFFPWLHLAGKLVLHHPMDLPVFLRQIETERVAYTIAPPAMLNMLLKQRELMRQFDLSSLRVVASGSAPLSPWMVKAFEEEFGIVVVNVFGSNEGMALISAGQDVPDPEKRAALFPRFGVEGIAWANGISARMRTRLVDPETGAVVDTPGKPGEMLIWGPNVIDGYLDAPEANREVFSEDGYFRTGDLFEIAGEDQRFYRFVGRCKDIVIRGGMKISPDELDTLLAGHPRVAEVAVVGYPDEVLGERICAVVVPKPGEHVDLADIVRYLEERQVARIKLPEKLLVVDQLPRNPLGKVVRPALRELVLADRPDT